MNAQLRLSVLIVDDYPDAADSLADLLLLYGHRVAIARTAREALSAAVLDPPDVVLLELRLNQMDGWQVARRLRGQARTWGRSPLLVVAVTVCGREEDRQRSAAAEIDLHLTKPIDPDELRQVLARCARRRAITTHPAGDPARPHPAVGDGLAALYPAGRWAVGPFQGLELRRK